MRIESVSHLSDSTLEQELEHLAATDRGTTVRLLVHVAEFDSRKLHLKRGYASMYAYCVGPLKMSEDIACKRIRAARAARRFPFILHLCRPWGPPVLSNSSLRRPNHPPRGG